MGKDQMDALEKLVDETSLARVLIALTEIAEGKSEHLAANWQDDIGAKLWSRGATAVRAAWNRCQKLDI